METKECIKTRRSIRKFKDQKPSLDTINELIELASQAPSWKNRQPVRYTVILDDDLKDMIGKKCVLDFELNTKTILNAPALIVVSYIKGLSGYEKDGTPSTANGSHWESFDTGVAAQTLCLAAHDMGLGTVIQGVIDGKKTAGLIGLPKDEEVGAFICIGYPDQEPDPRPRKPVNQLLRVIK